MIIVSDFDFSAERQTGNKIHVHAYTNTIITKLQKSFLKFGIVINRNTVD